jgi:uncharacterized protein YjdB
MFCNLFMWLSHILCTGCKGGPLHIVYKAPGLLFKGIKMINLTSGVAVTLGLTLDADAAGNPTGELPGAVTWTVSDATKATIVPSADGKTAVITGSMAGTLQVTATSGSLTDTQDVTVVGGVTTGIHIVQLPQ